MENKKATVTLQEAVQIFRDAGISISLETLKQGIIDKEFPIGVAIHLTQWVFIIYRKSLLDYLRSVGAMVDGEAL